MGCGTSRVDLQVKEAAFRNSKIERQLWQDKRTELKTVRILLLGEHLKELGVETKLGAAVTLLESGAVVCSDDERIEAMTVVWTACMEATALAKQIPGERDRHGRLYVDQDLRVPTSKEVFATGDAACAATDSSGHQAMMSCQHAIPLGRSAGHNAAADLLNIKT